mgnify:FL=1
MKSRKIISITLALITALFAVMSCIPTALAAEYQANGATYFTFTDGGITASEGTYDGYKIEGTSLTINDSGTYVLSGSCADGSVKVKRGTTGVTLVLSGLTLTSSTTAPIACNKSTEVRIIVASGSVNTLTDSAKNNDDNYPDNTYAENAVIKCKDGSQVTLSGSGTLNITANGKSGIKSGATTDEEGEARMTISDLTLNITASVNDAINAEQLLNVTSGNITISAGDDAIHSDYILNIGSENGEGPVINIKNCHSGLEAATLNVYSGNITIHASDDCLNAANSDLSGYAFSLNIYGGTLVMDTTSGDGVDSNGSLTISGGTLVVWSANTADNQPLDADGTITISGGTVLAAGGSNGMGMNLSASQPYVIYGSASGMGSGMGGNFPGGGRGNGNFPDRSDQSGDIPSPPNGGFTGDMPSPHNGDFSGDIPAPPSGGFSGDTNDTKGGFTGGNPYGGFPGNAGSSVSISSGSTIALKDSSGNTVYSGEALCSASVLIFSSSALENGETYTLYVNNTETGTATASADGSGSTGGNSGNQPSGNQSGSNTTSHDQTDSFETDAPDNSSADSTASSSSDSNTGLWIAIGVLSAALAVIIILLCKTHKK